jgi:hypothetical protein
MNVTPRTTWIIELTEAERQELVRALSLVPPGIVSVELLRGLGGVTELTEVAYMPAAATGAPPGVPSTSPPVRLVSGADELALPED